ncbi:MAG: universal stress protein [Candidatus Rokubacteria bacterium]|nr:universal stress protein [Candidatus Rokubacteria bacterium]
MFRRILVAYDGSEGSKRALRVGVELAKAMGAHVVSLSVRQHLPYLAIAVDEVDEAREQIEQFFQKISDDARTMARASGVPLEAVVRAGHEVETTVTFAKEGAFDVLVVGFTGHSNVFGRIMGGTAQNLVRLAPCPVLVVK